MYNIYTEEKKILETDREIQKQKESLIDLERHKKKTDSLATIDINNNETITSNENKIKEEKNFNIINLKRNSKSNLMNNIMRRSNSSNSFFDENLKENSILYQRLTGRTFFRKGTIKTIDAMKSNPIIFQKPFSFLGDFIKYHEGFKN